MGMAFAYSGACVRMISAIEGAWDGLLDFGINLSLFCDAMSFIIWSIVGFLLDLCESELEVVLDCDLANWVLDCDLPS